MNERQFHPAFTSAIVRRLNASFSQFSNAARFHEFVLSAVSEDGAGAFTNGGPEVSRPMADIGGSALPSTGQISDWKQIDADLAIALHSAFPGLTRSAASDSRLWNRLTWLDFAEYTIQRWPWPKAMSGSAKHRFLLPLEVAGSRPLVRNAISRLWWTAEILKDSRKELSRSREEDDVYAYVRLAFKMEDVRAGIIERPSICSAPGIAAHALHWHCTIYGTEDGSQASTQRPSGRNRGFLKRLQIESGYTALASLSFSERDSLFGRIADDMAPSHGSPS